MVGTVSNLIVAKRFGFISGGNGQEYFFHMMDVVTDWDALVTEFVKHGGGIVKVVFTPEKTSKGPRARGVTVQED